MWKIIEIARNVLRLSRVFEYSDEISLMKWCKLKRMHRNLFSHKFDGHNLFADVDVNVEEKHRDIIYNLHF